MRAKDMHPLCCLLTTCPGISAASPADSDEGVPIPISASGSGVSVAGVMYKWTNIGKGWRRRWFSLHDGVLSYSKIRHGDPPVMEGGGSGLRLIGSAAERMVRDFVDGDRRARKPVRVVQLKICSFRESKSDDRKFYVFSQTSTLQLRTNSSIERVAWIEALQSARSEFSSNAEVSCIQNSKSFSTEKLRERMLAEGLDGTLIRECEQIMHSEFSEYHKQVKFQYDQHISSPSRFQQQLEVAAIEDEPAAPDQSQLQFISHEFSASGHEKYSEYSTTESSDDVEKQELDELSDEEDYLFFDAEDSFGDSTMTPVSTKPMCQLDCKSGNNNNRDDEAMTSAKQDSRSYSIVKHISRRKRLPVPMEKEKSVSLWSLIKDNVGKDLTRVCLPVYFNEPISSLQKCFEDLEYSHLLDQAYEHGKQGNSLLRILHVAAFAVSGYASCDGRLCKPFNPLLGETYEADYPEQGIRFFAEKVSHHPMLIACHCEGKGWKFWGDSNLKSKFWGQSIQLDPVGVLTLEFDDGEIFQWSKVTTTIYNLIIGKVYLNHHGVMNITGNRQYSCQLKFKEQTLLDRNPRQVYGFVEDATGNKAAFLMGKWDDSMYYTPNENLSTKGSFSADNAHLLWKRSAPPPDPTRYNLTSFAITLNELTTELQEKLPPTDSRLRPDQRYLENGEYEKANAEKLRLERRQRMARKLQDSGWKPRWFQKDGDEGTYQYVGGYWEARELKKWDDCMDIFGEFSNDSDITSCNQ